MWTIYDHPLDFPDEFVARRWETTAAGAFATSDVMRSKRIELIRQEMERRGLYRLERFDNDDPNIMEVWL